MIQTKPIAIIGFMGCGKSTVGRMAANELGVPFSDLDAETENLAGMRVPQLFETQGELALRRYESLALSSLAAAGGILATSGGCIMLPQNRRVLENGYRTVYLDAPFEVILPRIAGTSRPLLRSLTENELQRLFELRKPLYARCADITLDASRNPAELADMIVDLAYT